MEEKIHTSEQLWERQEKEPNLWYIRFERYRLAGPKRSIRSIYIDETKAAGATPSTSTPSSWQKAAKKWKWKERAEAWDAVDRQQFQQEFEQERIEDKKIRIKLLKAFRNKIVQALNELKIDKPELADFIAALKVVTQELREEYGDTVIRHEISGQTVMKIKLTWSHQTKEENDLEQ